MHCFLLPAFDKSGKQGAGSDPREYWCDYLVYKEL